MKLVKTQSTIKPVPSTVNKPDLVFFYSQPLTEVILNDKNQNQIIPIRSDILNTSKEFSKLTEILNNTGKKFQIVKQNITIESLGLMAAKQPQIIHFSCHGDYDKKKEEFYLQFEKCNNGEIGI